MDFKTTPKMFALPLLFWATENVGNGKDKGQAKYFNLGNGNGNA